MLQIIFPAISGLLTALAFGGERYCFLAFFSLVLLWLSIDSQKQAAARIALFAFCYYLVLMLWLYRLQEVASLPQMLIAIVCIAGGMAFVYAVPFLLFSAGSSFELVLLFLLSEFLTSFLGYLSFPWGRLGVILAPMVKQIQVAALFGVLGISFVILCVNMLLAIAIRCRKFGFLLAAGALVLANYLYGSIVLAQSQNTTAPVFKVGIVQGGIGSLQKWQTSTQATVDHYLSLSQIAVEDGAALIVFPETAIPTFLGESTSTAQLKQFATQRNVELLVGGFVAEGDKNFNSLLNITNNSRYHKRSLVPFGEFVPFGRENMLWSGDECTTIETRFGRAGALICYDSVFPSLMRTSVKDGAEFLVVSTNDSWFARTPALYQHHAHSVLRAVESRRYLVRSANTGLSSVIRPTGQVMAQLPSERPGILTAEISPSQHTTLYVRIGDVLPLLILGYFLFKKISPYRK